MSERVLDGAVVAVLGLGQMGSAMAGRLLAAGVRLRVWNRTPGKAEALLAAGASELSGLQDAWTECDVVLSMVLDDAALDALHDPSIGLFSERSGPRRLRLWVDGSTVSPTAALRAAAAAHEAGVAYVSAPVSGNAGVVRDGGAVFAISGDEEGLNIAEELVSLVGRRVFRVGRGAEANIIKLATNALLADVMQSLAEIVVLADKASVSRRSLLEFVNDSAVGSAFTRYKTPNLTSLTFSPTFTAENQRKDIRLALDLARELEVPMPVLSTTEVEFSRLVSGGLGEGRDYAALVLDVARDAGHVLRPE